MECSFKSLGEGEWGTCNCGWMGGADSGITLYSILKCDSALLCKNLEKNGSKSEW